ncbi:Rho GTPase-activating protein, partial [Ascoidea rubescens DSM 1968]
TLEERVKREKRAMPLILMVCMSIVESKGIDSEGIYRKSGGNSQIEAIEKAFDKLPDDQLTSPELEDALHGDINAVTSALKRFLRRLPEPIITYGSYEGFINVAQQKKLDKKIESLTKIIDGLPKSHQYALYSLTKHLNLIALHCNINLMNFHNLAIVFAPTLARDLTGERDIQDMQAKNDVTECLIKNHSTIF